MTERIYIALLDEGIDVWRPVDAQKIGPDTYLLPTNINPAALGETWEFPPGAAVICRKRNTADGEILAAVALADKGRQAV